MDPNKQNFLLNSVKFDSFILSYFSRQMKYISDGSILFNSSIVYQRQLQIRLCQRFYSIALMKILWNEFYMQ